MRRVTETQKSNIMLGEQLDFILAKVAYSMGAETQRSSSVCCKFITVILHLADP